LSSEWSFQLAGTGVETTPIVVDGIMFVTSALNNAAALDARTGRPIWRYLRRLPDVRAQCLVMPDKTMTKTQELTDLKKRDENIASLTLMDMKVRVYGNVAIVKFREHEDSTKKNTDSSGDYLYTDVFVKRQGHWQAVNSQGTPVTHK
jgi:outer membrane protein assembly factor BamB